MALFEVSVVETVERTVTYKVEAFSGQHAGSIAEAITSPGERVRESVKSRGVDEDSIRLMDTSSDLEGRLFQLFCDDNISSIKEDIVVGHLKIKPGVHDVFWNGFRVKVQRASLRLLIQMAMNAGRNQTYAQLSSCLHEKPEDHGPRSVAPIIKRLRKSLCSVDPSFDEISNVSGVGYRWDLPRDAKVPDFGPGGRPILIIDGSAGSAHFCGQLMALSFSQFKCLSAISQAGEDHLNNQQVAFHGCPDTDPATNKGDAARSILKTIRRSARNINPDINIFESKYGVGTRINPAVLVM